MQPPSEFRAAAYRFHRACRSSLGVQAAVDRFYFSALAPVRPATALLRTPRRPRTPGGLPPPLHHWLCSGRRRVPVRPFGTPCRTVRRTGNWAIPSLLRVTLSATSEHLLGLIDSRQSLRLRRFLRLLSTEASSLHRRYPASSVLPASRHPIRPGLTLTSCQLIVSYDHRWGFPCFAWSPLSTCRHHYPGSDRGGYSLVLLRGFGLPRVLGGSAPASAVSGPAQCSHHITACATCRVAFKRPSTSEAPAASLPPLPLRLLPGGANQFPGGNFNAR
jgi:hypothetical protein